MGEVIKHMQHYWFVEVLSIAFQQELQLLSKIHVMQKIQKVH